MRFLKPLPAAAGALALAFVTLSADAAQAGPVSYRIGGQAWTQAGRLMHAGVDSISSSEVNDVSGTSTQSLGGQIVVSADLGDRWDANFGVGVYQLSTSLGTQNQSTYEPNFLNATMFRAYLAQANVTYSLGDKASPWFSATAGNFSYDYNPDVKNLGLYLLRGPVYPGLLMSGFGEFDTDPDKATQTGFKLHHAAGAFSHDLMLVNERILPPLFDWSLAYVAKYRASGALEVGGGFNLYRVLPNSKRLETPGHLNASNLTATNYYEIDTAGVGGGGNPDTTFFTHQGTKLMAMFSFDPKQWLPFSAKLGREDMKVYGEVAVLGLENYGKTYDDIKQRIPVMMGFNVPTFGLLDVVSLEVEYYASPYKNDLANIGNPNAIVAPWMWQNSLTPIASPGPVASGAYADSTRDNWKWSVFARKTVAKRVQFTAQIANDHTRPAPLVNSAAGIGTTGGTAAVLTSPKDWYFMGRVGFFF